jgi:hypothetical protein
MPMVEFICARCGEASRLDHAIDAARTGAAAQPAEASHDLIFHCEGCGNDNVVKLTQERYASLRKRFGIE